MTTTEINHQLDQLIGDAGTARVIGDGCQILYDPDGRLARLVAKLKRESDGGAVWTL